jgi:flagellar biosynthesis/type III secretory pathway chaperone
MSLTDSQLLERLLTAVVQQVEEQQDTNKLLKQIAKQQQQILEQLQSSGKDIKRLAIDAAPSAPDFDEVRDYFTDELNLTVELAMRFHTEFSLRKWKDSKGNPISNWQRMAAYWCKQGKQVKEIVKVLAKHNLD